MKHKKTLMSVSSVLTAFSLLVATNTYVPMKTSAATAQLNLKIYMDESVLQNFNEVCDEYVVGTYGVPTSFTTRLSNIKNYLSGFYSYHGANIHFSDLSYATDILESPAYICAGNSDSFTDTLISGCECYGDGMKARLLCFKGSYQHNNLNYFVNSTPTYNASNECAVYLTASSICLNTDEEHKFAYGVANPSTMFIVSQDSDYFRYHEDDRPYAYAIATLAHEIGHIYGVQDHYDLDTITVNDPNCIWGDNRDSYGILKSCTICTVCKNIIKNNSDMYHHTS